MTRPLRSLLLLSCVLALGACASDPPALLALPAAGPPALAPVAGASTTVLLRPVRIPGYLDGLTVVTRRAGGEVAVAPDTEWAERLGDGTTRVLAGALDTRLGPGNLLIEGDGRIPDADLSLEIIRMDPADGRLVLQARWTLVGSRGEPRTVRAGSEDLTVGLSGGTAADVAAATSQALAGLADRLAGAVASFPVQAEPVAPDQSSRR
ncbi:PqiC family protein [Niveispirillum sp. KHB5.9]|uniref:PqiC family protein n=1 Tax=Niveispirillum sp. KHB5.9 TaxID=3400269 RepID=UPI003A87CA90